MTQERKLPLEKNTFVLLLPLQNMRNNPNVFYYYIEWNLMWTNLSDQATYFFDGVSFSDFFLLEIFGNILVLLVRLLC